MVAHWSKLEFASGRDLRAWVGLTGSNEADDVALVVDLLNKVPASQGGPDKPLAAPRKGDPLLGFSTSWLGEAIQKFQRAQFGSLTYSGTIGPSSATLYRLIALAGDGSVRPGDGSVRIGDGSVRLGDGSVRSGDGSVRLGDGSVHPIEGSKRAEVLKIADAEVGLVGDTPVARERRNWQRLRMYFDESLALPIAWNAKPNSAFPMKVTDSAGTTHQLSQMLDGVRLARRRVPQSQVPENGTFWRGVSWCGIFANWAWTKAALGTKWQANQGPTRGGVEVPRSNNLAALMPGDIVVMKGMTVHHALVARVRPGGREFETIDGNTEEAGEDQTVARHMTKADNVSYFYSMDSVATSQLAYSAQFGR